MYELSGSESVQPPLHLVQEIETNEVEVINEFSDFNTAFDFAEGLNDECTDHIF